MIVVPPPEGISPEELQQLLNANESQESSQGEFDDVDSILAASAQSPLRPSRPAPGHPAPRAATGSVAQPLLPSDEWTSSTAQNRRRWVMAISAAVAIVALVAVTITAIVVNQSGNSPQPDSVAQNSSDPSGSNDATTDESATSETSEPDESNGSDSDNPDTSPDQAIDDTSTPDPGDGGTDADATTDAGQDNSAAPDSIPDDAATTQPTQTSPDVGAPPVASDDAIRNRPNDNSATANDTAESQDDPEAKVASPRDPFRGLDSLLDPAQGLDAAADSTNRLTELDQMLEGTGTSLSEIRTIAATFRALENVGLPRYYFEKTDPLEPEILQNLEWPCTGVFFETTPLQFALADVTRITGVPIQWDVSAIRSTEVRLLEPITIKETEVDFRTLLNRMVAPRGLSVQYSPDQLPVIRSAENDEMVEATYQLPEIQGDGADAKLDAFAKSIQVLIDPESWKREESPAKLERHDRTLTIVQTPANHREIARYIERIENGLRGVAGQPMDPEQSRARWIRVDEKLQTPFRINSPLPLSLNDLVNRFSQQTGVALIIDWNAALGMGWTPTTSVPGYMVEQTGHQALTQICRSLEMTWQVIDDNTIQLTSYETASQRIELDVYPVHKILAGRLTEQALMLALEESLSLQFNRTPQLQVLYEPECQCIIVYAPQNVHRQIHAVLQRLGAGLLDTASRLP